MDQAHRIKPFDRVPIEKHFIRGLLSSMRGRFDPLFVLKVRDWAEDRVNDHFRRSQMRVLGLVEFRIEDIARISAREFVVDRQMRNTFDLPGL